jgi:hypothetical protein
MEVPLKAPLALAERPTLSLIGERYLDTQHDAQYIEQIESELGRRGVVGVRRFALEYVAASSLWWNVLWMDWVALDQRDMRIGWISNLAVMLILAAFCAYFAGAIVALIAVASFHALTLWMGFELYRGSREGITR